MKDKLSVQSLCAIFVALLVVAGCSSQPTPKKNGTSAKVAPNVPGKPAKHEWDYAQIRDARQAEDASTPPSALRANTDENCVVMSREQMIRAKSSGCRPMNPREGGGVDSYCCPPQ